MVVNGGCVVYILTRGYSPRESSRRSVWLKSIVAVGHCKKVVGRYTLDWAPPCECLMHVHQASLTAYVVVMISRSLGIVFYESAGHFQVPSRNRRYVDTRYRKYRAKICHNWSAVCIIVTRAMQCTRKVSVRLSVTIRYCVKRLP